MKSLHEIAYHLCARRPIIWVETFEEERFIEDLIFLIEDAKEGESDIPNILPTSLSKYDFYGWSYNRGLQELGTKYPGLHIKDINIATKDPINVFPLIQEEQEDHEKPTVKGFIFKDLHRFLGNGGAQVIRGLRDLTEYNHERYVPIIIVAPEVAIPPEIEKLTTVVTYDFPTEEEIQDLVESSVATLKELNKQRKELGTDKGIRKVPTKEQQKALVRSCLGLTRSEIILTFQHSLQKYNEISSEAIIEEKMQLIKKSGALEFKIPKKKFENIGGNEFFKEWVDEIEHAMTEEARAFGNPAPKGYVALGIPGTSKTLGAEALAQRFKTPMLRLDMSKILDRLVGGSEKNVDKAFRVAKACAPCVLLVDEIEKNLGGINSSNSSDSGTLSRVFSKFLEFMEEDNGVFVIMTANDVSQLPPELSRSGRTEKTWFFGLPTLEERIEIFRIHLDLTEKKYDTKIIKQAAEETANYTGAEIEAAVRGSIRKAYIRYMKDKKDEITKDDLLQSIKETIPLYKSYKEELKALEAWSNNRVHHASKPSHANPKKDRELLKTLKL